MTKTFTFFIFVLAFTLPLLLTVWWPGGRRWRFAVLLILACLGGWSLILSESLMHKFAHDANIYERASMGLPVTQIEYMDDGVGDNALALFGGWMPPLLGAGVGWSINIARLRVARRRGFPIIERPAIDTTH